MSENLLEHNGGNDYTLDPNKGSIWVTVGNISVHICPVERTLIVAAYPKGRETENPVGKFQLYFRKVSR
jgi:hypothetical protein